MSHPQGAQHLAGDTWYVPGLTNSGYVEGLVIDTSPDASVYDGLESDTLLLTHGHADHFYAGHTLRASGAHVIASRDDARLVENPEVNIRGMFSWARPGDRMVTKLFKGTPCGVDGLIEDWNDPRATTHLTPGHTLGHYAVLTHDGVLFSGDAVYQEEIWDKHRLPYAIDPGLVEASLTTLLALDFDWLVPGHGEACDREAAQAHIAFHRQRMARIEQYILDTLSTERTTEEIVALVSDRVGLPGRDATYWLAVTTVKGFLGHLLDRDVIEFFVRDHTGWWRATL